MQICFPVCSHMKTKHEERSHLCGLCGKLLATTGHLSDHMRGHNPEEVCDHCGKRFSNKRMLQNHIFSMHTNKEDLPYHCEVCGKGFGTKVRYLQHLNSHNKSLPYKCRYCDKRFNASANRRTHEIKLHNAPKLTTPRRFN